MKRSFMAGASLMLFLTVSAWGSSYKILYTFKGGADGANPIDSGTLAFDSNGNLYGTTQYGGTCSQGTLFMLSPNGNGGWTETVAHSFCGGSDGAYPWGGVLHNPDSPGALWLNTMDGGSGNDGVNYYYAGSNQFGYSDFGWLALAFPYDPPAVADIPPGCANMASTTWGGGANGYGGFWPRDQE